MPESVTCVIEMENLRHGETKQFNIAQQLMAALRTVPKSGANRSQASVQHSRLCFICYGAPLVKSR